MSNTKHLDNLIENYSNLEETLVKQLLFKTSHGTTQGTYREEVWLSFFKQIIPKKFQIARSVFIIDSHKNISKEVDLAIYDEQYTPYILNYGEIRFIPIEAVAAVIECKSTNLNLEKLKEWTASMDNLKTNTRSIVRIVSYVNIDQPAPTQISTRPIKILCHLAKNDTKVDFDIVIKASNKEHPPKLNISFNKNNLLEWHQYLNFKDKNITKPDKNLTEYNLNSDYQIKRHNEPMTMLSFIFQFNQLLMLINNPMFFPHRSYVEMFNDKEDD